MAWLTVGVNATFQVNLDNTRYNAQRSSALLAVRSAVPSRAPAPTS
jgi:hypothetical protein